jgi:hypothetical protein
MGINAEEWFQKVRAGQMTVTEGQTKQMYYYYFAIAVTGKHPPEK